MSVRQAISLTQVLSKPVRRILIRQFHEVALMFKDDHDEQG
ncbi:hypothetical Protein YC6258_03991 [Gynuella sunshinyii YC6258]|uniref:Uncharacterized protein n=1 Tax=Gynuella sunshinyii YC6258 TaxID=1445510 RepID=A0A0C5VMS0_9GAMM|nr:hypothetical Protein YC6258_03991 [Gynuella sunshinyii YC6258]